MTTATATSEPVRTIQATIHQDAIQRVSAFFNATTAEVLNELLQNARRSGATEVSITTNESAQTMTVQDDGEGISDPDALLAFGMSRWDQRTARSEHPAGMGLYSLARRERTEVRSKHSNQPAWVVELTPANFTGEIPAKVWEIPGSEDEPTGTSVTFSYKPGPVSYGGNYHDIRAIENAARFYPLPVSLNGKPLEQWPFLKNAEYTKEWQGVRIGVRRNQIQGRLNFHGILVHSAELPLIKAINEDWTSEVDTIDCEHLELTLPARKDVVQTPFIDRLREECFRAIYEAMALHDEPVDVPKAVQKDARKMGVNLPGARPMLPPWKPLKAADSYHLYSNNRRNAEPAEKGALLLGRTLLSIPDQQALARAMNLLDQEYSPDAPKLMLADPRLEGYEWYDNIPEITGMDVTVRTEGATLNLKEVREQLKEDGNTPPELEDQRPEGIILTLETQDRHGNTSNVSIPADMVFLDDEGENCLDPWDIQPLVTGDSAVTATELTELMEESFFSPSDDKGADSYETQREAFVTECRYNATTLLDTWKEALEDAVMSAVKKNIMGAVPQGYAVNIRVCHGQKTQVNIEQVEAEQADAG